MTLNKKLFRIVDFTNFVNDKDSHQESLSLDDYYYHEENKQLLFTDLPVLVADDVSVNQKVLSTYLKKLGIKTIFVANHGKEALDIYLKFKPKILFLDCNMPIMNGFVAAKQIKDEAKIAFLL